MLKKLFAKNPATYEAHPLREEKRHPNPKGWKYQSLKIKDIFLHFSTFLSLSKMESPTLELQSFTHPKEGNGIRLRLKQLSTLTLPLSLFRKKRESGNSITEKCYLQERRSNSINTQW